MSDEPTDAELEDMVEKCVLEHGDTRSSDVAKALKQNAYRVFQAGQRLAKARKIGMQNI